MAVTPARALLHFLLLGASLFAAVRWWEGAPRPEPVVLGDTELAALRSEGEALLGRPPDAGEWEALVAARVDEEILLREALARGLDQGDPVIRERLARNLRFVGEAEEAEADELVARARAIGMDRTDLVVRRRLVDRMRAVIEAPARSFEPGDPALREWLDAHPERFAVPRRVAFHHVFFDAAEGGEAEARAALAALARPGAPPPVGDTFLAPRVQPLQTELSLARYFGADFAAVLFALPDGRWAGPVASSGGVHLVLVLETRPAEPPDLEHVRAAVLDAVRSERAGIAVATFLAEQRLRYGVAPSRKE